MFLYLFYLKKYGIHIGCISPFYHHGDVNIETHLVVCLYMNQIAASFRIAGIIIATTKGSFLGEFWGIQCYESRLLQLDSSFGEIWQPCKLRCFSCTNET